MHMYAVEKYVAELRLNLSKETENLVEKIRDLKSIGFAEEVKYLFITADGLGEATITINATTREDMFDDVFEEDVENGFAGDIELLEDVFFDSLIEDGDDDVLEFYEDNDLEDVSIKELGKWVKSAFNQADGNEIAVPVYFEVHDGSEVLELATGKWVDPEEL